MSFEKPTYINGRGQEVELCITKHAKDRFSERWGRAFNKSLENPNAEIVKYFSMAKRMDENLLTRKYLTRLQRYGKDTLFFKKSPFVFVVQDAMIRTVELCSENYRNLNKQVIEQPRTIPVALDQIYKDFRIIVFAMDQDNKIRTLHLGKLDSSFVCGQVELLKGNDDFREEVLKRLYTKFKKNGVLRLSSAFVTQDNKKVSYLIFEEKL